MHRKKNRVGMDFHKRPSGLVVDSSGVVQRLSVVGGSVGWGREGSSAGHLHVRHGGGGDTTGLS